MFLTTAAFAASNTKPIANAGADRTGSVNVAITFNGSGSYDPDGTIVTYWWQFGDGASTTTASSSASHAYATPGTYSVALWVADAAGNWSAAPDTAIATISSGAAATTTTTTAAPTTTTLSATNKAPTANAGPNQATQTFVTLTFDGSASRDSDGYIYMAQWLFGDGTSAAGLVVQHQYAVPGTYTATLRIMDDDLVLATDTATITVANRVPVANAGPNASAAVGAATVFDGSGSTDLDGDVVSYAWTFGDGTSGTGPNPMHAYAAAGTYTATLTVTDDKGARDTDTALVTVAASASSTWSKKFGSTGSDAGFGIAGDASGNTFLAGSYRGTIVLGSSLQSVGGADVVLAKYSPTGSVLWARSMGGTVDDYVDAIAVDGAGDVIVAGRFAGTTSFGGSPLTANGSGDMVIAKYSGSSGAHQWSKRFGGPLDDAASAVAVDGSRNVYVTGYFRDNVDFGGGVLRVPYTSDLDVFVLKLSSTGAHVWSKNFVNNGNERGYGIAVDGSGNVAVAGYFSNSVNFGGGTLTATNAMTDAFVARFTTNGAHTWSRRFGASTGNETAHSVRTDSAGNVIVAGSATAAIDLGGGLLSALGGSDAFVAKYAASSGAHVWSRRLGSAGNDYGYGVAIGASDAVYVAGTIGGLANLGGISLPLVGRSDAFVAKYSATGAASWAKGLGGVDADVGRSIGLAGGSPVVTGFFFASGSFNGTTLSSAGGADGFVVRLNP